MQMLVETKPIPLAVMPPTLSIKAVTQPLHTTHTHKVMAMLQFTARAHQTPYARSPLRNQ